jgi:hypothetical protein
MPVDYSKGKIYQIVDYTNDNVYVGSTCEPTLARRLANHVNNYKAYLNGDKKYMSSYKIIENNNYDILLIEAYPCNTRDELHKREGYYIKNTPNCVNKFIAGRTDAQYRQDNKEKIVKQMKQHYDDNKQKISEVHKKYYENNKEKISEVHKQYYEKNREKLLEKKNQTIKCTCGMFFTISNKSKHEKSQKHKSFIENQQVTVN